MEEKENISEQDVIKNNLALTKDLHESINSLRGIKFLSILIAVILIVILIRMMGWI